MPKPHAFILALDFGLKNIGVAVGQKITKTANGLTTLRAKNGHPNWNEVRDLVDEYSPSLLLVGYPLNMDGSESEMSERARIFATRLEQETKTTTALVDERLTTREAKRLGKETKIKGLNKIHEASARLIAESWLDQN